MISYKGNIFYMTSKHIAYMKEIECLSDNEVCEVLESYWNIKYTDAPYYIDYYNKNKGDKDAKGNV